MRITYTLADIGFESTSIENLAESLKQFLSEKKIALDVKCHADLVEVEYPEIHDIDASEDENIVLNFCRARRFGKAKKVVKELIEK